MSHDAGHESAQDAESAEEGGAHGVLGPAEIPPAPEPRMITPAREDYVRPFPGAGLLWPMVWLLVAVGFLVAARRWEGEVIGEESAAREGSGEAPAHAAPEPSGDVKGR